MKNSSNPSQEWFAGWFDSPYYPVLYQHRNDAEAEAFLTSLITQLSPHSEAHILDLACGRGRHSRYLAQMGFRVTGLDLSPESIREAQEASGPGTAFFVHDMREPFPGSYDHIFNLFTSFGYFESTLENARVLNHVREALHPGGVFILDFMNTRRVLNRLVAAEEKTLSGIRFEITRKVVNGIIVKTIGVQDPDQASPLRFQEKVQALTLADFETLAREARLSISEIWGDYELGPYQEDQSPRLILKMEVQN